MATRKQIRANRKNAGKSTGPKTYEGKAASSLNATKHGLYAQNVVINSPYLKEDPQEFEDLCFNLMVDLDPHGPFQYQLVIKIATCMWRQRRVINAETASINQALTIDNVFDRLLDGKLTEEDVLNSPELLNRMRARAVPRGDFADTLMRYERRLEREFQNTLKLYYSMKREEDRIDERIERKARLQAHSHRSMSPPPPTDDYTDELKNCHFEPNSWQSPAPQSGPTACRSGSEGVQRPRNPTQVARQTPEDTKNTHNEPNSRQSPAPQPSPANRVAQGLPCDPSMEADNPDPRLAIFDS